MAHIFGLQPTVAFDLTVGWDMNDKQSVKFMWEQIIKVEPLMIFGSPRCIAFSSLSNWNKDKPAYPAAYEEGLRHLKLCFEVYQHQKRIGR